MSQIEDLDIWRIIPPEEKLEMMAYAQSKGVLAVIVALILGGTCAVALKIPGILWFSLATIPVVFQFAQGKAWRTVKPAKVLRYLAARSAARRYAFAQRGNDLNCMLMFRGKIERLYSAENAQDAIEAAIEQNKEAEVWIGLFRDAIVMMSEQPGGAKLEFGHLLNDKVSVEGKSPSDGGDYASDKELIFSYTEDKLGDDFLESANKRTKQIKLTSKYPAALIAFEKKIQEYRRRQKENAETLFKAMAESKQEEVEKDDLFDFDN